MMFGTESMYTGSKKEINSAGILPAIANWLWFPALLLLVCIALILYSDSTGEMGYEPTFSTESHFTKPVYSSIETLALRARSEFSGFAI